MKFNWINLTNAAEIVLLYLPFLISRLRNRVPMLLLHSKKAMQLRRIGFWGTVVFLEIPVTIHQKQITFEFGFSSLRFFGLYAGAGCLLILISYIFWILYTGMPQVRWIRFLLYFLPPLALGFSAVMEAAPLAAAFAVLQLACLVLFRRRIPENRQVRKK